MPTNNTPIFENRLDEIKFNVLKDGEYVPYEPGVGGEVEVCVDCLKTEIMDHLEGSGLIPVTSTEEDDDDELEPLMTVLAQNSGRLPGDYAATINRRLWLAGGFSLPIKLAHYDLDHPFPDDTVVSVPCEDEFRRPETVANGEIDHGYVLIDGINLLSSGGEFTDIKDTILKQRSYLYYPAAVAFDKYLRDHPEWDPEKTDVDDGLPVMFHAGSA